MELKASTRKGYHPAEKNKKEDEPLGLIAIDSLFTPVKKVSWRPQAQNFCRRNLPSELHLEFLLQESFRGIAYFFCSFSLFLQHCSCINPQSEISYDCVLQYVECFHRMIPVPNSVILHVLVTSTRAVANVIRCRPSAGVAGSTPLAGGAVRTLATTFAVDAGASGPVRPSDESELAVR